MREWCWHCPKTTVPPYAKGLHEINSSKIKPSELAACPSLLAFNGDEEPSQPILPKKNKE